MTFVLKSRGGNNEEMPGSGSQSLTLHIMHGDTYYVDNIDDLRMTNDPDYQPTFPIFSYYTEFRGLISPVGQWALLPENAND